MLNTYKCQIIASFETPPSFYVFYFLFFVKCCVFIFTSLLFSDRCYWISASVLLKTCLTVIITFLLLFGVLAFLRMHKNSSWVTTLFTLMCESALANSASSCVSVLTCVTLHIEGNLR